MLKRIFKIVFKALLVLLVSVGIYMLTAFTLSHITVNNSFVNKKEGVKIFVVSNGDHTDIVLPANSITKNWSFVFPKENFDVKDTVAFTYIGFGWGDKGFYMDTPTWADLKFSTAFKAVFGMGGTAMHVRYLKEPKPDIEKCVELMIDEMQYKELIGLIETGFVKKDNSVLKIDHPGYGEFDRFYEATGTYSALKTCNNWTDDCLKKTGIKASLWSPFSQSLMHSLKQK